MDIRSYIRTSSGKMLAALACAPMLYACDGLIYDDEGDCTVNYRVKFRYDYNMKIADAFAREVNTVTLYLLDAEGRVVWQRTEQGEALSADGYAMTVNVEPGEYGLLVWCGTTDKGSFSIPETTVGNELTCTLGREHDAGNEAFVAEDLDRLFHGWLPEQTFGDRGYVHLYRPAGEKHQQRAGGVAAPFGGSHGQGQVCIHHHRHQRKHGLGQLAAARRAGDFLRMAYRRRGSGPGLPARRERPRPERRFQRGHRRADRAAPRERTGSSTYRDRQGEGEDGFLHSPYRLRLACERFLQPEHGRSGISRQAGRVRHGLLPR